MNSSMSAYQSLLGNTSVIESSILNPQSPGTLSTWLSESQTGLTSCRSNIEHPVGQLIPLLYSVAMKRVTISRQCVDVHKRIHCRGNAF
jgi:hypothetical protein